MPTYSFADWLYDTLNKFEGKSKADLIKAIVAYHERLIDQAADKAVVRHLQHLEVNPDGTIYWSPKDEWVPADEYIRLAIAELQSPAKKEEAAQLPPEDKKERQ